MCGGSAFVFVFVCVCVFVCFFGGSFGMSECVCVWGGGGGAFMYAVGYFGWGGGAVHLCMWVLLCVCVHFFFVCLCVSMCMNVGKRGGGTLALCSQLLILQCDLTCIFSDRGVHCAGRQGCTHAVTRGVRLRQVLCVVLCRQQRSGQGGAGASARAWVSSLPLLAELLALPLFTLVVTVRGNSDCHSCISGLVYPVQ